MIVIPCDGINVGDADVPTMSSMIFTTVVRIFLRAGIRAATDLLKFSRGYIEQGIDVDPIHIQAYQMLDSTIRQSPISLEFAGKFLEEIDAIMEKILSGLSPHNHPHCNRKSKPSRSREQTLPRISYPPKFTKGNLYSN